MDKDIRLIDETLKGNQVAFRTLVEHYKDYVFTITFKILRNREEAEEAAQDAFLKAYRALASFEKRSAFSTWLYQIAWRAAIDKHRAKQPLSQSLDDDKNFLQIEDPDASAGRQLQRQNVQSVLQVALARMKPEDATLLTLYYLHEQPVKEIAEVTGLTESNVKVKLFRLRDSLKNLLTQQLKAEVKDLL
jgi:RNA polymerase sigma-70 factor (ECF subfamily)